MHAATSSLLLACPTGSRVASSRRAPRHARVRAAASSAASSTSSSTPARLEGEALESYTKKMAEDLTHLFDETGIDRELYESDVSFEDPLTKYDNIDGYLFNIDMLKNVFTPVYTMHTIEQTGDWELSTRWTSTAPRGGTRSILWRRNSISICTFTSRYCLRRIYEVSQS